MRKIAILLTVFAVGACSTNEAPPPKAVEVTSQPPAAPPPPAQGVAVGQVRALITRAAHPSLKLPVCWGPSTDSVILSSAEALSTLEKNGITPEASADAAYVIEALKKDAKLTAVRVVETAGKQRHELLVLPEAAGGDNVHLLQLVSPKAPGDTCVYCTDYVGQLSGPRCKCSAVTRKACGKNPEVSCVSECTFCPNGGGAPPEKVATDICNSSTPWESTVSYATLAPGGKL